MSNIINNSRNTTNKIKKINIYSDSEYSVKTFNEWLPKWKKLSKKYLNSDLINKIDEIINTVEFQVKLIHVRSHSTSNDIHSISNNIVDELAKKGAMRQ